MLKKTMMIAALLLTAACSDDRSSPSERVGAPLAVNPEQRQRPSDAGADAATPADGGGLAGDTAAASRPRRDAGEQDRQGPQRPQPAKALALAADADRRAAEGDLTEAMAIYGRALELNPRSPWFYTAHAWFLARQDRQAGARDALERALDLAQRRDPLLLAAIHLGIGELRELRGDLARARESYRIALRAWAAAPLARALLGITPRTDVQYDAALRVAFDERPPERVLELFGSFRRHRPQPLAHVEHEGRHFIVSAQPPSPAGQIAAGAHYALHILATPQDDDQADAGLRPLLAPMSLGETAAVRWHRATARVVPLAQERQALISTLERTAPGVGAPLEVGTTIVAIDESPPRVIFTRVTGSERDDPLGCRRGWREQVELTDSDGDGTMDAVALTRHDRVTTRLESAASYCTPVDRARPRRVVPFLPREPPTAEDGPTSDEETQTP